MFDKGITKDLIGGQEVWLEVDESAHVDENPQGSRKQDQDISVDAETKGKDLTQNVLGVLEAGTKSHTDTLVVNNVGVKKAHQSKTTDDLDDITTDIVTNVKPSVSSVEFDRETNTIKEDEGRIRNAETKMNDFVDNVLELIESGGNFEISTSKACNITSVPEAGEKEHKEQSTKEYIGIAASDVNHQKSTAKTVPESRESEQLVSKDYIKIDDTKNLPNSKAMLSELQGVLKKKTPKVEIACEDESVNDSSGTSDTASHLNKNESQLLGTVITKTEDNTIIAVVVDPFGQNVEEEPTKVRYTFLCYHLKLTNTTKYCKNM